MGSFLGKPAEPSRAKIGEYLRWGKVDLLTNKEKAELSRVDLKQYVKSGIAQLRADEEERKKAKALKEAEELVSVVPIDFKTIGTYEQISKEFIKQYIHRIDFSLLSNNKHLTDDIVVEFINKLDLDIVFKNKIISDELALKLIEDPAIFSLYKNTLLKYYKFPENIIRKLINYPYNYKDAISRYQDLSEELLSYNVYNYNWDLVCRYQKLSLKFIDIHQELINWNELSCNKNLNKAVAEKYLDKLITTDELEEALKL